MYDEYTALVKTGTWLLVLRPEGVYMVHSMWLFKHKFHADGSLSRYKAHLVANGSSQQLGVDFDDTFNMVVKPAIIRMVLSLAVSLAYLLLYVDDIILTASSITLLQHLIDSLHREFDMTDLGALNYFLGISAIRHSIGGLQYLTFTHPDLSYAVQQIFLYMHNLREPHLAALKRILRYVQGTLDLGLHLYASSTTSLLGYTDVDWEDCPSTRRLVLHVPSRFQYADIFTKGLPSALFEEFQSSLSVRPPSALTVGAY
ncbi:ribonuclease H-like domain-containing protein [Tanacetum coccineum]